MQKKKVFIILLSITFTLYITFILYIYYNKENNRDESKQKQKIKAKKQRYREKRRQREVSSDRSNILSPIDPNTLLALKSYIKLVDEQIDQTIKVNVDNDIDNKIEDEIVVNNQSVTVEEEKETIIITVEEEETPSIVKIEEIEEIEENNIIVVNNNEEKKNNNNNIINENVETDDLKITSQLNNSLSNGLLLTSINNRVNRYGFHEYEIIISDKSFIQPINGTMKIYRRYNDFYVLNALLHASGFDNLPLLPRKQFFKFIHDENFLNERQQQLDNYLKNVVSQYTFQSAGIKNLIRTFLSSRLTTTTIEEI